MKVFFDVLDTLVAEDGEPRLHSREVFLDVEDVVRGCCLKRHPPEGVSVDYAVDDDQGVVEEYGGYLLSVYRGDPWDAELLGVVEALSRGSGR